MSFKFELKQTVAISISGEQGSVTARAEYADCENQYRILYMTTDKRACETWWAERTLEAK